MTRSERSLAWKPKTQNRSDEDVSKHTLFLSFASKIQKQEINFHSFRFYGRGSRDRDDQNQNQEPIAQEVGYGCCHCRDYSECSSGRLKMPRHLQIGILR